MVLWGARLASLINTALNNLKFLGQRKAKEKGALTDSGTNQAERHSSLSMENESLNGYSSALLLNHLMTKTIQRVIAFTLVLCYSTNNTAFNFK